MTNRKKKIKIIQILLLSLGCLIIFITYLNQEKYKKEEIISKSDKKIIDKSIIKGKDKENVSIFYDIEYSGLDIAGNRYILKSKEATSDENNQEIVKMKYVEAFFYFKDDTIMRVTSNNGAYNNKTLDMKFSKDVKAYYEGSKLLAEKAEYSNSKSLIEISNNVKINDVRGEIVADKLLFDIKKKTLNINSFSDNKINANINLKWKKVLEF